MRFEIGQKIWTVGFTLINKNTNTIETSPYFTNPDPKFYHIDKIHFVEISISEHKNVPDEFSEELKYDGFIATDGDNVWHNQFPRASYGQLSNKCDHLFDLAGLDSYYEEVNQSNLTHQEVMTKILKKHPVITTCSLVYFMNELTGGLLDENGLTKRELHHPDVHSRLCAIADLVVSEFKKQTGHSLICYNKELNLNDKTTIIRSWKIE